MDISVILPTYKPQNYLWECLDSLCNQTFPKSKYEIVLVLNGCDEPYNSDIQRYIIEHDQINIQYKQIDNAGVSNARNVALQISTGDYITFIDDDDYVSPTYLESLFENASESCVSVSNTKAFDDVSKVELSNYTVQDAFDRLMSIETNINKAKPYFQGVVRKMIHKSIILDRRFDTNLKNGEDSLFMFLISDNIKTIKASDKDAIYYRRVRENSANYSKKRFLHILKWRLYLIWQYLKIYMVHPRRYNFVFFITRILGSLKTILQSIYNK